MTRQPTHIPQPDDLLAAPSGPPLSRMHHSDMLLTTPEAATYLGISPKTLETWRSTGRQAVPYVRVGRLIRYRMRDLDEWMASRSQNHTGETAGE